LAARSIVPDPLIGLSDQQRKWANGEADRHRLYGEQRDLFLEKLRRGMKEPLDL
jgi:hypothetical protein